MLSIFEIYLFITTRALSLSMGLGARLPLLLDIVASSFTKAMPMTYLSPKMALHQAPWSQICLVILLLVIQASCLSFTAS